MAVQRHECRRSRTGKKTNFARSWPLGVRVSELFIFARDVEVVHCLKIQT